MVDVNSMTYGYELEISNVRRDRVLPDWAGTWEYAETDILNTRGPYALRASDPLGLDPPVGGEVNIVPARSPEELTDRICDLIDWFRAQGDDPDVSLVNHGHVHAHVPGLIQDVIALRRLAKYVADNQNATVEHFYRLVEEPGMDQVKEVRNYLRWDGGRLLPEWMAANIITRTDSFDDFIRLHCCGKDGVSRGRPFRYAINMYCLKHTQTVEFRCLRASIERRHIFDSIRFARDFMKAALEDGPSVPELIRRNRYSVAPLNFNVEQARAWWATKWDKERGKKVRRFQPCE